MQETLSQHKGIWKNRDFVSSVVVAFLLLALSITFNFFAGNFAIKRASNSVSDLLLDNLPFIDTTFVFIYGAYLLIVFIGFLLFFRPEKIAFVVKNIALFIFIRAVFVTLTHLGEPISGIDVYSNYVLSKFTFGADLFFSGHTGLPYLMALICWKEKLWRNLFLVSSVVLAGSALLGRAHYSIDIFAAYFITYSIFHIAQVIFKKDYELTKQKQ